MRAAFLVVLFVYCCLSATASDVVSDARKLLASETLDRARAEKILLELPVQQGRPGWEERAFLFAEFALKTDKQTYQRQAEQAFTLLTEKATASWKRRGEIGLVRLSAIDDQSRTIAVKKLDDLTAELTKANDESAVDAAYALGLLYEQSANPERATSSFEHARKMLAHVKSYYGKDAYKGIVTEGLLRDGLVRNRKPDEEPRATYNKARGEQRAGHHEKAIELFSTVKKGWPDHELAQASDYYEEESRVVLNQIALAESNLKDFIKTDPSGPWRGHANLLVGDVLLERAFKLAEAARYFQAIIEVDGKEVHASWREVQRSQRSPGRACILQARV